ncbi:MAG: sodium:solute symporter family protein [Desulfobulbaceae bacterium]|nr:sodium:solute symporter family protein [Desulfobulbaceae bacterium]
MNNIDLTIVSVYLIGLFCWAIYIGLRETVDDFLILSRRAPFTLVLFSMISTWVGSGTTIATAASGYDKGISLGLTAAVGGLIGVIAAAWFAPNLKRFGDKFSAHTLGDFFLIRYSSKSRIAASLLILLVYLLLTGAQFVGLATLLSVWAGVGFKAAVWFAAISTVIYTAFAGIKSDFYTDIVHFIVMFIVLFFILLPITLQEIGGARSLLQLPKSYFDPFAYGGKSFFIAGLIFGAGSVFVTMELWQRIYASASEKVARWSLAWAIVGIILFYVISAFFGMSAKILLPDLPNRDQALFALMNTYLPTGMLGLGIAGFMAVFISTLNSTLMVASATITKDFYKGIFRPDSNSRELLVAGRVITFVCGMLGLAIAMALPDLIALSVNGLFMLLVLLPAVIGGFFSKRVTAKAALLSIISGVLTIVIFMSIDASIAFVPGFLVSLIIMIVVSFFSKNSLEENHDVVLCWASKDSKIK